jgi:CBS domain-containing protein
MGICIGILTETDIQRYFELQARFDQGDATVVDEMFEADAYGQRRVNREEFDQVHRHMSSPPVTISNLQPRQAALEWFENHPDMHHLIVVDESNRPVGVIDKKGVFDGADIDASKSV